MCYAKNCLLSHTKSIVYTLLEVNKKVVCDLEYYNKMNIWPELEILFIIIFGHIEATCKSCLGSCNCRENQNTVYSFNLEC